METRQISSGGVRNFAQGIRQHVKGKLGRRFIDSVTSLGPIVVISGLFATVIWYYYDNRIKASKERITDTITITKLQKELEEYKTKAQSLQQRLNDKTEEPTRREKTDLDQVELERLRSLASEAKQLQQEKDVLLLQLQNKQELLTSRISYLESQLDVSSRITLIYESSKALFDALEPIQTDKKCFPEDFYKIKQRIEELNQMKKKFDEGADILASHEVELELMIREIRAKTDDKILKPHKRTIQESGIDSSLIEKFSAAMSREKQVHAFNEFVMTEFTFLRKLKDMLKLFEVIEQKGKITGHDALKFNRVRDHYTQLYEYANALSRELNRLFYEKQDTNIDGTLSKFCEIFSSNLFKNYIGSLSACTEDKESRVLESIIQKAGISGVSHQVNGCNGNTIGQIENELTIEPGQRIGRYPILLKALLETTDKTLSSIYNKLFSALETIEILVDSFKVKAIKFPEEINHRSILETEILFSEALQNSVKFIDEMLSRKVLLETNKWRTDAQKSQYRADLTEAKEKYTAAYQCSLMIIDKLKSFDGNISHFDLARLYHSLEFKTYRKSLIACKDIKFKSGPKGILEIVDYVNLNRSAGELEFNSKEIQRCTMAPQHRVIDALRILMEVLKKDLSPEEKEAVDDVANGFPIKRITFPENLDPDIIFKVEKEFSSAIEEVTEALRKINNPEILQKTNGLMSGYSYLFPENLRVEVDLLYDQYDAALSKSKEFIAELQKIINLQDNEEKIRALKGLYESELFKKYYQCLSNCTTAVKEKGNFQRLYSLLDGNLELIEEIILKEPILQGKKQEFEELKAAVKKNRTVVEQRHIQQHKFMRSLATIIDPIKAN